MGHSNGIITTTGINTADVSAVLGAASNDVGTLCLHANINMWSKYKPIYLDVVGFPTVAAFQSAAAANKFGINFTKALFTQVNSALKVLDGQNNGWEYERPKTWKRLGDFAGYDHGALPPVEDFDVPTTYDMNLGRTQSTNLPISITLRTASSPHGGTSIKLTDLAGFSDYYLGVLSKNPNGSITKISTKTKVSAAFANEGVVSFEIPYTELTASRTYSYLPVMFTSLTPDAFYMFPMTTFKNCAVTDSGTTSGGGGGDVPAGSDWFELEEFNWNAARTAITIKYTVTNTLSKNIAGNVTVTLYYRDADGRVTTVKPDTKAVSIAKGDQLTNTVSINSSYNPELEYYLKVTTNISGLKADDTEYTLIDTPI